MPGQGSRRRYGLVLGVALGTSIAFVGWPSTRAATSSRGQVASPAPKVTDPTCHLRSDCGAVMRGGLQITFTGWACTTGFVARDKMTSVSYVLTAGHCVAASGLTAQWSHHGVVIGPARLQGLQNGSSADVGAIEIEPGAVSDQLIGSEVGDIRSVDGIAPDASQTVGSIVCRSGATSGWGCGRITAADVDARINGVPIHRGWWIDIPSASGDSGAPVVDSQGRAAGIAIATTSDATLYSTVDGIDAELGLTPCVTPSCD